MEKIFKNLKTFGQHSNRDLYSNIYEKSGRDLSPAFYAFQLWVPLIIDLEYTNRNIRKSVFDKLYQLGYKWNNGYLSMDVGIINEFWRNKNENYISDRNYVIIGPVEDLNENQMGHLNKIDMFDYLEVINANDFLSMS